MPVNHTWIQQRLILRSACVGPEDEENIVQAN
jgi:hypothetical protein